MNSIHDIGGMDGFGTIPREADEPVFHEPWESRVFGMMMLRAGDPTSPPLDAARHRLEKLPPRLYLTSTYYERWLASKEQSLIEVGTLTRAEIEAKVRQFTDNPSVVVPRRKDPIFAAKIPAIVSHGSPASRPTEAEPRFVLGEHIITRNLNPHGHTRLPRYARSKPGVITAHHGAHVFPDTNAHGLGENPQHLYTVRFSAKDLWGDAAEPNEYVTLDLWESYLAANRSSNGG